MTEAASRIFDIAHASVRELNQALHDLKQDSNVTHWRVLNARGRHAIAAGVDAPGQRSNANDVSKPAQMARFEQSRRIAKRHAFRHVSEPAAQAPEPPGRRQTHEGRNRYEEEMEAIRVNGKKSV